MEIGQTKRLEIGGNLDGASIAQISLALQPSNSEMKELSLWYTSRTISGIENYLVSALRHPNCNLVKLRILAYELEHKAAAKTMEDKFCNCLALFVLLQGQQVRRLCCPLRRLPVGLLRLVGKALM